MDLFDSFFRNIFVVVCRQARIQTACELIERIGNRRGELVKNMRNLCEAYIELAYFNVSQFKNERGTVKYFILISRRYDTITGLSSLNWPFPMACFFYSRVFTGKQDFCVLASFPADHRCFCK